MALLTLDQRKAIFKELGLEYNEATIKALQSKYMLRKKDADGIYGTNTDNMLRTVWNTLRVTKNFDPKEFRCDCGGRHCCGFPSYMKANELKHIQAIRDHWGRPITVTQGLRCKGRNKELKGSAVNSGHMYGRAIDFYQKGVTDTLANRKASIKWIKKQFAHKYSYGNGIDSSGYKYNAPYMGNCLHTETTGDNMAEIPKYKEEEVKPTKPVYKVIDVSDWQDKIDWNKVKADGVVGAIIRYADGTTLDKRFQENMVNAKAAGLHVGSYIFSRAKTKAQAEAEAERLFNACKPYDLDMPLYIDLEVSSLSRYADTVAAAFLNKMASLGARGGVYANLNWWNHYLTKTARDYSSNAFWIAQYNDTMDYKPASRMGMWQYTSSGKVDGINGNVDMNECYLKDTEPVDSKPVKVEYPELGKEALIKVADAVVLACDEIAFPYSTPESKTKYNHAKDYKITKYDSDRPTAANKAAFDRIFPNHWKWGSEKYGYGQRVNACCDDFAALIVRYSGADPKCPHAVDVVARGDWNPENFTKKKYTDKSQLVRGSVLSYFRHGSGGHMMIIYSSNRRCDAGLNHFYGKIRSMGSKFWDFKKTIQSGFIYTPKDKYISITRAYLCMGMVSDEVRKLQKLLGVDDDSIFGPMTEKAVKAFQKENGLVEDGLFGAKSLAKLMERGRHESRIDHDHRSCDPCFKRILCARAVSDHTLGHEKERERQADNTREGRTQDAAAASDPYAA